MQESSGNAFNDCANITTFRRTATFLLDVRMDPGGNNRVTGMYAELKEQCHIDGVPR